MDKEWIFFGHHTERFKAGLLVFLDYALKHASFDGSTIKCPCKNCHNGYNRLPYIVGQHLDMYDMNTKYANNPWTEHGEQLPDVVDQDQLGINQTADFEEAEQRRLSMNIDITAPKIREELYAEVLGKEKGNRVRSLGAGVTWDEVTRIHVEERGISSEVKQLREQLEEQERKAQDRETRMMEEVQTKMAEERKRMEEMFEFRCVDMALQKMGQVFKQCGIPVDTQEDVMETLSQLGHQMSQRQAAVAFSQVEDVYRPTLPPIDCQNMQMDD